jgi:hypothetical protein
MWLIFSLLWIVLALLVTRAAYGEKKEFGSIWIIPAALSWFMVIAGAIMFLCIEIPSYAVLIYSILTALQ